LELKRLKSKAACFVIYATIFIMGLTLGTVFTGANHTMAAGSDIKIYLNNKQLIFGENPNDPEPYIKDGRTLVPFRKIFEALGMEISWNAAQRSVDANNESVDMTLYIGINYAYVNKFRKPLDVPPEITDGRTFVPLRFVSESYGAEVIWEPDTRSIYINYSQGKHQMGQEATYNGVTFTVDTVEKNTELDYLIVKGKISKPDMPLSIEVFNGLGSSYSREAIISKDIVAETGKYEYTAQIFVMKNFEPKGIFVKTFTQGAAPYKIAEYVY